VSIENPTGSGFADELVGDVQANRLTGSAGPDLLTGKAGGDRFVFSSVSDSPPGAGVDFDAGTAATRVDKIDLSGIDAQTGPGNQAFTFIGTSAFSYTKGQLRVRQPGTSVVVEGDVDGDAVADLEIELLNFNDPSKLTAIDFRL
jgi:Ca2+-binding RTX toxin-like protein